LGEAHVAGKSAGDKIASGTHAAEISFFVRRSQYDVISFLFLQLGGAGRRISDPAKFAAKRLSKK